MERAHRQPEGGGTFIESKAAIAKQPYSARHTSRVGPSNSTNRPGWMVRLVRREQEKEDTM